MKLSVTHFRQQQPYTCLVTCVRMILAYAGQDHTEDELSNAFNTIPMWGTQPEAVISGLETLGYHGLWFENAGLERLFDLLNHGWPVIVFLRAADLPHGHTGIHAIVIIGIEGNDILYLDPTVEKELHLDIPLFLVAWANLGNQGMVAWI